MPQKGVAVKFKYGLQNTYNNSDKELNTLYFCTDTQRLFLGEVEYTRPIKHGTSLPDSYLPPDSFFIIENEDLSKELHYSKDGLAWELVSILPKKIIGGVFGINLNTTPSFGENIVIPRIQVNEYGAVTSASNQSVTLPIPKVSIRLAENVTDSSPEIIPETFIFDQTSLALYVDIETGRKQVKDPLKLSLTGGQVRGTIEVLNIDGTTSSKLTQDGIISGKFLESTGDIHIDTPTDKFAVIDETGRIRTRSKAELQSDLDLGSLAYKDNITGKYTPFGKVSAPEITVKSTTEKVISSITLGEMPTFTANVQDEVLTLSYNSGTNLSYDTVDVIKSIDSVTASEPEFTGTEGSINIE